MFSFKRRSHQPTPQPSRSVGIEPLEARAYFAATVVPATATVTVPGPIPATAIAGVVVHDKIGVNISDNDTVKAKGKVTIALFASTDSTLDSGDAQIQPASVAGLNINPGRNHTFKINVKSFPQNLDGTFFILAEVTGSGVNPAFASSTATITVAPPTIDLGGTVTKTPANGRAGRKIPVTVQITNTGNILAKGALAVGFSLSLTPDGASPASLGSLRHNIHILPGKSTTIHFMVPLALGIPTGNQYVVADVDPSNAFLDANLINNFNVGQQPVTIT